MWATTATFGTGCKTVENEINFYIFFSTPPPTPARPPVSAVIFLLDTNTFIFCWSTFAIVSTENQKTVYCWAREKRIEFAIFFCFVSIVFFSQFLASFLYLTYIGTHQRFVSIDFVIIYFLLDSHTYALCILLPGIYIRSSSINSERI